VAAGAWPAKTVDALVVHGLRMLAFNHLYSPDLWDVHDISTTPRKPAATHALAGRRRPGEHVMAVYGAGRAGGAPLAQIVLFGRILLELPLPGLDVRSFCTWLLSTADRRVVCGVPEAIADRLLQRRRAENQLALL
jgi:hypothetical protein